MSMKKNNLKYRNQIIYQVFPRNFSKEGTFSEIIKKLSDIKKLGTDILYLMPINEIGVICRKGVLGSPYSIKDYYEINKEYGDLEDLKRLISATHDQIMFLCHYKEMSYPEAYILKQYHKKMLLYF